jgi:membrane associated rhomboid family serine protease
MAGTMKPRSGWTLGTANPATVLAEARKALFIMAGFIAVIWIVQIVNWADHNQLTLHYGIKPHQVGSLPDILTAPFLHFSWSHIEGNSGPLFIFGFIAAYRGIRKFLGVTRSAPVPAGWCSATSATSWSAASSTGTRSTC